MVRKIKLMATNELSWSKLRWCIDQRLSSRSSTYNDKYYVIVPGWLRDTQIQSLIVLMNVDWFFCHCVWHACVLNIKFLGIFQYTPSCFCLNIYFLETFWRSRNRPWNKILSIQRYVFCVRQEQHCLLTYTNNVCYRDSNFQFFACCCLFLNKVFIAHS